MTSLRNDLRCLVLVAIAFVSQVLPASAQVALPITHPASESYTLQRSFDRQDAMTDLRLWPVDRHLLGFDTDPDRRYARLHFTCRSSSDSATGRCATVGRPDPNIIRTEIALRFTEERSGQQIDLNVGGHLSRAMNHRACGPWLVSPQALHSTDPGTCASRQTDGTGVTMDLPARELSKLAPGRWRAQLILDLQHDQSAAVMATYTFDFTLTVTDRDSVAIYFPAHPVGTPHIGLNLRQSFSAPMPIMSGVAVVDMCLYDGLGSASPHLDIEIRDEGVPPGGRPPGMFSVHRQGGSGLDEDRVDFEILLNYQGTPIRMNNGVAERLAGTDSATVRPVRLPGTSEIVYCVPSPLTLRTPPVSAASKRTGYYLGRLTVEMTLPASTP